ncbi:hypothetical protein Hanom_Chr05g00433141 [Helianthus anomalus]
MHYHAEREGVPKFVLVGAYHDREWYKTLTHVPTPIIQLEEKAPVAAWISIMWVPKDPRAAPVYAFKGKVGYSLMNVLDLEGYFLHPSSESLAAYGFVILGAPSAVETEVGKSPTREETILLSSGEFTGSLHRLSHRSTRAGPCQRPVQVLEDVVVSTPLVADPVTAAFEPKQKESRKGAEKKEPEKKNFEKEPAGAQARKYSSKANLLDYVVVSDSLFGLDAGTK